MKEASLLASLNLNIINLVSMKQMFSTSGNIFPVICLSGPCHLISSVPGCVFLLFESFNHAQIHFFCCKNVMVFTCFATRRGPVGRLCILRVDRKPVKTTVTQNLGTINFTFFRPLV